MVEKRIEIQLRDGLHLRPAKKLCQLAGEYEAHIVIQYRNKEVNAKSLLGVLSACIQQGDEIAVRCSGADETAAADAIAEFINRSNEEEAKKA